MRRISIPSIRLVWIFLAYSLVYWLCALVLPHASLIEISDAVTVSIGLAVLAIYGRSAWRGFLSGAPSGADYLIVGIALNWPAQAAQMLWRLTWRMSEYPHWMVNHPVLGYVLSVAAFGGILHIAARTTEDGVIPARTWAVIIASILSGVGILVIALVLGALGRPWADPYAYPPPFPYWPPYTGTQVP